MSYNCCQRHRLNQLSFQHSIHLLFPFSFTNKTTTLSLSDIFISPFPHSSEWREFEFIIEFAELINTFSRHFLARLASRLFMLFSTCLFCWLLLFWELSALKIWHWKSIFPMKHSIVEWREKSIEEKCIIIRNCSPIASLCPFKLSSLSILNRLNYSPILHWLLPACSSVGQFDIALFLQITDHSLSPTFALEMQY